MVEPEEEHFPEEAAAPPVFQVDETLAPLQAVMEWAAEGNPPGQRVAHILSIPAAAAESSLEDARNMLLPLLSQLAFDDHPDVKHATAEVLGPLGQILAAKDPEAVEAAGSVDAMDLLVLAHRLLQDGERGIQQAAASSVAAFAALLSPGHREEHLTAVVDALMHSYDDEQSQECAVDLLTKVAAAGGAAAPGWCCEHALPRLLRLANHRDYNIRVHAVAGLVQLAGCLPEEERGGRLLGAFADLCGDSVWSVRADCAAQLAAMAVRLPRAAVRDRLLPLWATLAGDVSGWVQSAARRQAGPLLAALHPDDPTEDLLDAFVSAAAGPPDLSEACAQALPAVLRSLGPTRWPQLKSALPVLAASESPRVRVLLAASLHEVAAAAGGQAVAADVLPVVQALSSDVEPAVGDALAAHVAELLAALPPGARLAQLGFLSRMHPEGGAGCGAWRTRLAVARQLAAVAALLGPRGLCEVLLPATLRLCEDPVAAVREAAALQLGAMVGGLLAQAHEAGGGGGAGGAQQEGGGEGGEATAGGGMRPPQPQPASQEQQAAGAAQQDPVQPQQQQAAGDAQQDAAQPPQQQQPPAGCAGGAGPREGAGEAQPVEGQEQAAPASPPAAQQERGAGRQEGASEQGAATEWCLPSAAAAVVQQVVQHMVELQRSGCHRARQTYLAFCAALLLPSGGVAAAGDGSGGGRRAAAAALPDRVAGSGTVQGLLEGAVALAADTVPNVRLGVARLLAAIAAEQPRLAASNAGIAAALARLAADQDRDVREQAGVATEADGSAPEAARHTPAGEQDGTHT